MYIKRRFSVYRAIHWTKGSIVCFGVYATAVVFAYHKGLEQVAIPVLPVSLLGTAVSFYLGFKNNSAYDRLWESRKVWGAIAASSRAWCILVRDYITNHFAAEPISEDALSEIHKELVYRHIAWLTVLRHRLRLRAPWEHNGRSDNWYRAYYQVIECGVEDRRDALVPFLDPDELDKTLAKNDPATHLLSLQSQRLRELHTRGLLDNLRHIQLEQMLVMFCTQQGRCERLKTYPLPRMYATLTAFFVWMFIVTIPVGLVAPFAEMGLIWLVIPSSLVLSWVFYVWHLVGDYSENPFEGLANDIPITAISRSIEIDLREMLGETKLPPQREPVNGVLS